MEYSYAGDRLISLREHVTNISDSDVYKSNGMQESHFTYDANGNMLTDTRRGMRVEYNTLNLPAKVWRNDTLIATYSYLADGTKLSVNPVGGDTLVYVGSLLTRRNGYGWEPELVLTQEGQVEYKNMNSYENKVFIRDNMGSVRAVWNGTLDSLETVMDYYPFGAEHQNPEIGTQPKPRYRYSGKEDQLEAMNGILDFGSRYYNPQIGRWLHPDPQAESYYQYSPYTYCANNPTNLIDPDGERIVVTDYFSSKTASDNIYEWTLVGEEWQFVDYFTLTLMP